MVKFFQALGGRVRSRSRVVEQPVDLDQVCATIHHGCMGLPQELVDHVMDILYDDTQELVDHVLDLLHDDIPALKACSLTCKAMFVSTRHLIHRTLKLSQKNTLRVLTREEKRRYKRGDHDIEFRFISFMGERGLLQYARRVHICTQGPFTPEILLPHLHHFQSLNRVHSLTIDRFNANKWMNNHSTGFTHFYPTLTSLTLKHPCNRDRLLNFALRFPNLENLSLQWLEFSQEFESSIYDAATPEQSPPLRGCLRLVGYGTADQLLTGLFRELPKGLNFRSIELDNFPGSQAQHALNACARTLETLTIKAYYSSVHTELWHLKLTEMAVLRRLTLCTTFNNVFLEFDNTLLGMLSTIVSPVFCEFVLEIGGYFPPPEIQSMGGWELWRDFDKLFEERIARHGDFRLIIIIPREPSSWEGLRMEAERGFPLLADRGCIYLQTSHPI